MPWVKTRDGEEFVAPDAPLTGGPLPPGVKESDPAAFAQRRREYQEFGYWWRRLMVDWCRFYEDCPRKSCRRARTCRSPTVVCHDEAKAELRAHVYPLFREAVKAAVVRSGMRTEETEADAASS